MTATVSDRTVLAIVGPTASGKSSLALDVARSCNLAGRPTELVAVDAFTLYRGMDIGTAKPSPEEREEVPHHGLDLCEPSQEVTVAWFQTEIRAVIAEIMDRGVTPLLVGGSGLYFRAVVDDLRFPPTDPEVRSRLEAEWWDRPQAAHAHLADRDPAAAERIEPANVRRTVRALEVIELTGEAFSSFAAAWQQYRSIYPGLQVAYLEPPTEVLRQRIESRARAMVAEGLLDEVAALRAGPGLSVTAAKAIGYAEAAAVLDGDAPAEGLAAAIAKRTWTYAKRQRSWFRADPRCAIPAEPATVLTTWTTSPA